jgi:hypothetical protein
MSPQTPGVKRNSGRFRPRMSRALDILGSDSKDPAETGFTGPGALPRRRQTELPPEQRIAGSSLLTSPSIVDHGAREVVLREDFCPPCRFRRHPALLAAGVADHRNDGLRGMT